MEGSRFRARRSIDIRPGSGDNFVNVKSRGKIPVAILSTADFDAAARIAIGSLTFGRAGDEPSLSHCGGPEDVDGDGLADIVCHFDAQTAAFQPGDIEGSCRARRTTASIRGRDAVRVN